MNTPAHMEPIVCEAIRVECATAHLAGTPSHMLRPRLSIDGNKWSAVYGANLQDGVAGFGDSPAEAYADFDRAWVEKLPVRS